MNHACTYFDCGYLAQGVALWHSLCRQDAHIRLTVLALDDLTATVLRRIGGERLTVLELPELLAADPELARTRANRRRAEFIFSLAPSLVRHVFETRMDVGEIVYLDADLFFFGDPAPVWSELAAGSVLIVPHRYPHWHDDSARYGRYNVGVVGFRRDEAGRACVEWWRERCLESTTLTPDGVRYGDQKYLDEWPRRFTGVVESTHPGINVAPWNWAGHRITCDHSEVRVAGERLIAFHFAQFKRVRGEWFDSGQLEYGIMPRALRSRLYGPYAAALETAEREIRSVRPDFTVSERGWRASLGPWHLAVLRIFWGQFWLRLGQHWLSGRLGLGRYSGRAMGRYRRWRRRAVK